MTTEYNNVTSKDTGFLLTIRSISYPPSLPSSAWLAERRRLLFTSNACLKVYDFIIVDALERMFTETANDDDPQMHKQKLLRDASCKLSNIAILPSASRSNKANKGRYLLIYWENLFHLLLANSIGLSSLNSETDKWLQLDSIMGSDFDKRQNYTRN